MPNLDPEWIPGQPLKGNNDGHLTWADVAWLATLTTLPIVVRVVEAWGRVCAW